MRDDKFGDLPWRNLTKVNFSIRLKRAAGAQDRHPLNGIDVASDLFSARKQDVILEVEDARRAIRAFEQLDDANKVPSLAVGHGRVGRSLEQMRARYDALEKFVGTRADQFLGCVALHKQVAPVDLFPHF